MLIAGACVNYNPAWIGALTFDVNNPHSAAWWSTGSAFIYIMLFAGAGAADPPARGGAFTFRMYDSPLWTTWTVGSAY